MLKFSAKPSRVSAIGRRPLTIAAAIKGVVQTKPPIIFINAWPASKLANSRILRLITRAQYEMNSMIIKKGAITKGAPDGKNRLTNFQL
jgi:hypothetical protein